MQICRAWDSHLGKNIRLRIWNSEFWNPRSNQGPTWHDSAHLPPKKNPRLTKQKKQNKQNKPNKNPNKDPPPPPAKKQN